MILSPPVHDDDEQRKPRASGDDPYVVDKWSVVAK